MGKPIKHLKELLENNYSQSIVSEIKIVESPPDDKLDSTILKIVSKLALTHENLALNILQLCANDDIPRDRIMKFTIAEIEKL